MWTATQTFTLMDKWINAMGNATTAYEYRLCKINKQQIVTTMYQLYTQ